MTAFPGTFATGHDAPTRCSGWFRRANPCPVARLGSVKDPDSGAVPEELEWVLAREPGVDSAQGLTERLCRRGKHDSLRGNSEGLGECPAIPGDRGTLDDVLATEGKVGHNCRQAVAGERQATRVESGRTRDAVRHGRGDRTSIEVTGDSAATSGGRLDCDGPGPAARVQDNPGLLDESDHGGGHGRAERPGSFDDSRWATHGAQAGHPQPDPEPGRPIL